MGDYADFVTHLNDHTLKQKELLEKVTILHNEVAIALLETSSVYSPQVLVDLTELAVNSKKIDKYETEDQELKFQLENLLSRSKRSTEEYTTLGEELRALQESLNSKFNVDVKAFK